MYNGIINVYKEKGYTSHDVVAVLRGILGQKKVGHTGTLDPEATGVLPICIGKGTKVAGLLTDKDKTYVTTFRLGSETDTQDHTGHVIKEMSVDVTQADIMKVIRGFVGDLKQIPPMYSAIKIDGKRLYELAREGIVVERKERLITIHSIRDVHIELPEITMTVHCSKGTYIRTLCKDISDTLNTCGHMTALERIQSGVFGIDTALKLDQVKSLMVEGTITSSIIPIDSLFDYEKVVVKKEFYKLLDNGNKMSFDTTCSLVKWLDKTRLNVYNEEGNYMGIYEWSVSKDCLVPIKFFNIRQ